MRIRLLSAVLCLCLTQCVIAQNWDHIQHSGEYYYGVGTGDSEVEADKAALAFLTSQIASHVSSDFTKIDDITRKDGEYDHKSKVLMCVKTYSQSTLTNTERWVVGKEPNVTVRRYIKRSELSRIFDNRIAKAKDMVTLAHDCLQDAKVEIALQYYYWAYSLIRSVQFPDEVKDDEGRILTDWLPIKIDDILSGITVEFDGREDNYVDLLFYYEGEPVSSLEFTYSDGRSECNGRVTDGRGMIEMAPGYETDIYHLNIEYEYKGQARGDAEMESVLGVITPKAFAKAKLTLEAKDEEKTEADNYDSPAAISLRKTMGEISGTMAEDIRRKDSTDVADTQMKEQARIVNELIKSIENRNMMEASKYMTIDGLEIYGKLVGRGLPRVVNKERIVLSKRADGRTIARGLQMSFTVGTRKKQTVVDEVVFTLNAENKVENVAFGLGKVAEDDILNKIDPEMNQEAREMIVEFMENYKTAYNLKRINYIRDIFADDAVIIVGNVVKRKTTSSNDVERQISVEGQEVINYNRYTKDQYLDNLEKCMKRNEYINIRFSQNDVQWLKKFKNEEIFAIQIGQEYDSSTYSDMGYLFLLVDMTNHDEPQIKIRTWQPNEVDMDKIYHAGYFYNE